MDLTVAKNQAGNSSMLRDYRKGNWNLQETMVLIEAKKMDDERRMRRLGETLERGKPAELRWKWVEDYCWKNGCLRSQNQCNDKWDNLMRDYKKVREYEKRVEEREGEDGGPRSYWRIEKSERKDSNLPSNMLPEIYEALVEVVERKGQRAAVVEKSGGRVLGHHQHPFMASPVRQYSVSQGPVVVAVPPPPPPPPAVQTAAEPPGGAVPSPHQPLPTVDSDTSGYSNSPAKRRKKQGGGGGGGEGTSGGSKIEEIGSAISKSASTIAEAIHSCEEREERRHRELLTLHERRLQIEESKAEINKQGVNGLVDAINKLANSIFTLAARSNQSPASK